MNHAVAVLRQLAATLLAALLFGACAAPATSEPVERQLASRLARYHDLVLQMDSAGIATLFTSDGSIAHETQTPLTGRPAIRDFLDRFASFKVLAYEIGADRTTVTGGTAVQEGRYHQTVRLPDGKTIEVAGTFRTDWQRQPDGTWLIQTMRTASAPKPGS